MFTGKEGRRSSIFLLVVLVCAGIYYFFYSQPTSTITFSVDERTIGFTGPMKTSCNFDLDTVTEFTYYETPDYGTCVDGDTLFGGNMYGTWKSDTFGSYQAFLTTKIPGCFVISDGTNTVAFNYSNEETTKNLYDKLCQYVPVAD